MSIRLVTPEQLRLDVDVESYNRLMRDVLLTVNARVTESIESLIVSGLTETLKEQIIESLDMDNLAYLMQNHINYSRLIELAKTQLVANLLIDDRFQVLVQRGINSATIGVIDETVERVTAQLNASQGIESDV